MQLEFPDVERLHKTRQLEKMVGKGLWGVSFSTSIVSIPH
jgi:hypothetical protein